MKVLVDSTKCEAYGTCAEIAPEVFELDDFGYAAALADGVVPAEHEDVARKALEACPVRAIRTVD
ncbi:ferredoxin [Nocardioides sp. LHG3406-4]|uniref:ferredoxin n=1 Tax=Nocardioides sp. LHG3406-4 TaxID=2804575 RepID=UPI003CEF2F09